MQISELDEGLNPMQNIKRRFFAFRNGVVADVLRRNGAPYRIIFGLNYPQLREIADSFGRDNALASELWANISTRESRLLAPMLVDTDTFAYEKALEWLESLTGWAEEADVLCCYALRRAPYAWELASALINSESDSLRYAALRLMFNMITTRSEEIEELARKELERNCDTTRRVAAQLLDELTTV